MFTLRTLSLASIVIGLAACGGQVDSSTQAEAMDDPGGGQVCVAGQPDPRACDPANTMKTTVCHIPPGNPANRHTICIGNAAVAPHLAQHGDFIGSCCGATGGGSDDGGVAHAPDGGTGSVGVIQ